MSELVLTLRRPLDRRIDASPIVPDRMASAPLDDVVRALLRFENGETVSIGDLFSLSGQPSDAVRIVGDLSRAEGLGRGTSSGSLRVEGDAGRLVGMRMTGGTIEVLGDCGDAVGREMRGGRIIVRGSVGSGAGGASPGSKRGMTDGEIVVFGDAGAETAASMRRGLVAVAGDIGPDAARGAIAGTVVIGGKAAPPAGRWLKRASIVALRGIEIAPTYRYACTFRPPNVGLLLTYLRRTYGFPVSPEYASGLFERFCGDLAESGAGEILRSTIP